MRNFFSTVTLIFFYVCAVYADGIVYTTNLAKAQRGIVILPLAEIDSSNAALSRVMQQKQQGYVDKEFNDAKELLAIGRNYASVIDDNANPIDTHMKSDLSKIKLAFTFTPPKLSWRFLEILAVLSRKMSLSRHHKAPRLTQISSLRVETQMTYDRTRHLALQAHEVCIMNPI